MAGDGGLKRVELDPQIVHLHKGRFVLIASATECLYPGEKLRQSKWLYQIVVGPCPETPYSIIDRVSGGQEEYVSLNFLARNAEIGRAHV